MFVFIETTEKHIPPGKWLRILLATRSRKDNLNLTPCSSLDPYPGYGTIDWIGAIRDWGWYAVPRTYSIAGFFVSWVQTVWYIYCM